MDQILKDDMNCSDMQTSELGDALCNDRLNFLCFFRQANSIIDIDFQANTEAMILLILLDMDAFDAIVPFTPEQAIKEATLNQPNAFDFYKRLHSNCLKDAAVDIVDKGGIWKDEFFRIHFLKLIVHRTPELYTCIIPDSNDIFKSMSNATLLISFLSGLLLWGPLSFNFAKKKGRNPRRWYTVGFFFGLIGFSILMFLKPKQKPAPTPTPEPAKPLPLSYWYYLDKGDQIGPMSLDALKKAFITDKITEESYVWNEEMTDWEPLKNVPAYKHLTGSA